MAGKQTCFFHINSLPRDIELFLGGKWNDVTKNWEDLEVEFKSFDDTEILAHLMNKAGCFPSVGQARKNGWNKSIPAGFSEFKVGKNFIFILNLIAEDC